MGVGITLIVVLVVAVLMMNFSFNLTGNNTGSHNDGVTPVLSNFCSDNPQKTLALRVRDKLSTSGAYLDDVVVYVTDLNNGVTTQHTVDSGTSGSFANIRTDLRCGSPEGYEVTIKGADGFSSSSKLVITPQELAENVLVLQKTMETTEYTEIDVTAYDEVARAVADVSVGNVISPTSANGFTVGAGDRLDLTLTLSPEDVGATAGNGMLIAFNLGEGANLDDWNEDSLQVTLGGVALTDVTNLRDNEVRALSSYDRIFRVDDSVGIRNGVRLSQIDMRVMISAGDESAPSFNPVIRIVPLGDIKSTRSDEVLRSVGFMDNSGRTPLYSAMSWEIAVNAE